MQNPRLRVHVVKDQAVDDAVVVFDAFPLFRTLIRGDDPLAAKKQPLDKAVEGCAFVRRGLNRLAQLGIAQIPE
jgi:hypothetical protein